MIGYDGRSMLPIEPYIAWLAAGFVLVFLEMVTGTFYLLVLGVAAFAGGAAAVLGVAFWVQALAAALVALAGVFLVSKHWLSRNTAPMRPLDRGQPVSFESWVNRSAGHARVRYRDASWEAVFEGDPGAVGEALSGDMFYVAAVEGNTLRITRTRPA